MGEGLGDVYLQMRSTWECLEVRELFCLGYGWSEISQTHTPTRQIFLYVNYKVRFQKLITARYFTMRKCQCVKIINYPSVVLCLQ